MTASRSKSANSSYHCARHRAGGACTGLSVPLDHADDYVGRAVFARLASLDPEDPDDADLLMTATERFAARTADGETARPACHPPGHNRHRQGLS